MRLSQKIVAVILLVFAIASCELKQKEFKPEDDWIKIYHHSNPDYKYMPVDFKATDDGYIIVNGLVNQGSDTVKPSVNVIETSANGEVINSSHLTNWYYPVGEIYGNEGKYFIACANDVDQGFLVSLDGSSQEPIGEFDKPLTSYVDSSNQLYVLGFSIDGSSSVGIPKGTSSILSAGGGQVFQVEISNTLNITGPNQNRPRSEYPIFIGESKIDGNNILHANMFSGSTLRLIFFNAAAQLGDVFAFQGNAAVKAILHKSGHSFILVAYSGTETYIDYQFTIPSVQEGGRIQTGNMEAYPLDLKEYSNVIAKRVTFDDTDYGMLVSTTANNQIGMLKCTLDSVPEVTEYHFPFDPEVELTAFKQDEEGNILVLGQVKVDTHPRAMLMKIPKRKFE